MKPSKYQEAVYNFISTGTGNAVINAVAGSGKTTTIVNALKLLPTNKKSIFLAFNKSIVEELTLRVPDYVQVQTLHSLGWSALRKAFGNRIKLNDRKLDNILFKALDSWGGKDNGFDYEYGQRVKKLANILRVNLCTSVEDLAELAEKHDIEVFNGECNKAFEVVKLASHNSYEFDYIDMLYVAAVNPKVILPIFDYIFVDECQDLNKAQQSLLNQIMGKDSRFIAVGDPFQCIYSFAGADIDSFNTLKAFKNTIELPLSISYRCQKNIVAFAQSLVPHLEANENAEEGTVNESASIKEIQAGDFVLCRNTAPLVKCCLEFLAQGVKAFVKGGDIGANLVSLVKKGKTERLDALYAFFEREEAIIIEKLRIKYPNLSMKQITDTNSYQIFMEKVKVVQIIADNAQTPIKTTTQLIAAIEDLFSEKRASVIFSTIHKSKGLESNRVFILMRGLMPSKYAVKDWQKTQENNLAYVAYTRAKSYLGFVTDWEYNPKNKELNVNSLKGSDIVKKNDLETAQSIEKLRKLNISIKKGDQVEMIDGLCGKIIKYASNTAITVELDNLSEVVIHKSEIKKVI